ncbi:hypothetical protein Leryth_019029 [Lithospermum erythrorhizon]|nr:hypothetical protein Leryth_019029 [Lithospermum erythrorhizon]
MPLYLSGRVDMKQVEKTIQYLIGPQNREQPLTICQMTFHFRKELNPSLWKHCPTCQGAWRLKISSGVCVASFAADGEATRLPTKI